MVTGNIIFQNRMKGVGYFQKKMRFLMAAQGQLQEAAVLVAISENYILTKFMIKLNLMKYWKQAVILLHGIWYG